MLNAHCTDLMPLMHHSAFVNNKKEKKKHRKILSEAEADIIL